jgi:uncharacterized protein YecE (DUF72 family)
MAIHMWRFAPGLMSAKILIGCSSWTSEAWWGRVYPQGMKDGDRLAWYARFYNTVEVDSSYYRAPGMFLVERWARETPDGFVFALKLTRDLLDPREPVDQAKLAAFTNVAKLLGPKLGPILLQFPPWVKPGKTSGFIEQVVGALDPALRYSVELRDKGWFAGSTFEWVKKLLGDHRIALTWSYLTYVEVPPEVTSDFVYLRFIGDHKTIPEETHGTIQVDRTGEMRMWAKRLRDADGGIDEAYIFFNNHFQGFAPESVNLFRKEMDLPAVPYKLTPTQTTIGPASP